MRKPRNFEEKGISSIGRPLFDAFIKGYSEKQWQTPLNLLPASIVNRLPVRFDRNDFYFDDPYEGIPLEGYTALFHKLLQHPKITVITDIDYFNIRYKLDLDCLLIYTGPIDRFFDYKYGTLGWRTVHFEKEVVKIGDFQGGAVVTYAETTVPFTRIHEFRHYHPERTYTDAASVICREYSKAPSPDEEPYYPINTTKDQEILRLYQAEMENYPRVIFGGRLAQYKYLNMDQVIGAALVAYEREVRPLLTGIPAIRDANSEAARTQQ